MRSLSLLRHAKTERDSASGGDFDRALTDRGRQDAEAMGRELGELGYDLVLASPAKRAVETAEALGGVEPRYDERIYNASTGELLGIVQDAAPGIGRLLLVGHNPGFEDLASLLAGEPIGMPPGALVEIALPIDDWRDAGNARGRLVRFVNPKKWD